MEESKTTKKRIEELEKFKKKVYNYVLSKIAVRNEIAKVDLSKTLYVTVEDLEYLIGLKE